MAKTINARLQQKHDIEANWDKATGFIPMIGEIIVYDKEIDDNGNSLSLPEGRTTPYTYARIKIGDGKRNAHDLPFSIIQPDWDQEDTNQSDYIKNKPDGTDALELLMELEVAEPVFSEDGYIYTDENGILYTL